jgi:sugar lactone lactonase YvrE
VTRELTAELVSDVGATLGEGPTWDARTGELTSVDILTGRVFVHDVDGQVVTTYDTGGHVGSALPAEADGWLLVMADGFAFLHRDGSIDPLLAVEADRPENRFNDAKCDPWGQALAGTMRYDNAPGSASLYRLEAATAEAGHGPSTLTAQVLLQGLGLANGLGWNATGDTMYFIDSLSQSVVAYPYAPDIERLGPDRLVAEIAPGDGLPDGMCVDAIGNLWVALYGGGAVRCFRPDGTLDTVVRVPVPCPTSVAFGGAAGDRLFITTAGGDDARGTGAGGLWAVDPGVAGPPATPWRGQ